MYGDDGNDVPLSGGVDAERHSDRPLEAPFAEYVRDLLSTSPVMREEPKVHPKSWPQLRELSPVEADADSRTQPSDGTSAVLQPS
jgi:hypothetical protein